MARFERDGEDKAIGEAELGMSTKVSESGGDDISILNDQGLMVQEQCEASSELSWLDGIDRVKDPDGLHENEMRDPGTRLHERLGSGELTGVVASEETDKNVRVNRAHGALASRT